MAGYTIRVKAGVERDIAALPRDMISRIRRATRTAKIDRMVRVKGVVLQTLK